jgi:hypothetical protein
MTLTYLPGQPADSLAPLARFLPPLPRGVAAAWLDSRPQQAGWVLDPFGSSPTLALEMARAGHQVLVTANNPIIRFLIEVQASPPAAEDLRAALAHLAGSRKGDERLEPHILARYATRCERCDADVTADAFIWEKAGTAPVARIYTCPSCGDSGERLATPEDAFQADHFAASALHEARALERATSINDPDRAHIAEALQVYPKRAIYVLFTLINKLDGLTLDSEQRRLLEILLLAAFDQGNALWRHPIERDRPRQLVQPTRYRENNIWHALEAAIDWPFAFKQPTPITRWPDTPPESGGIALFEGPSRDLAASLADLKIKALLTSVPRPNQAFWSLSALWAGWLWGADVIRDFKAVLRRRRYGWDWHTAALHAALRRLPEVLHKDTPIFCLLPEAEPGLITATTLAGHLAGLELGGGALRTESGQFQYRWHIREKRADAELSSSGRRAVLAEVVSKYLADRGEPADLLSLFTAGLHGLADRAGLPQDDTEPRLAYKQLRDDLDDVLSNPNLFQYYGSGEHGRYWLKPPPAPSPTLSDRIERAVVAYLLAHPGTRSDDLERALCQQFRGLETPSRRYLKLVVESYGLCETDADSWSLRPNDQPRARRQDLADIQDEIERLGLSLGCRVRRRETIHWENDKGPAAHFIVKASGLIAETLLSEPDAGAPGYIVIPGSRARLALHKIAADPRLEARLAETWTFVKFRLVRRLADGGLDADHLDDQLRLDPLTDESSQMRMM